jgi:hypothetical protein
MPERTAGTEFFIQNACSKEVGREIRIYESIGEEGCRME